MLMNMCLPNFDIYQGTVASNCFKNYTDSRCSDFFQKSVLSDIWSEVPFA